MTVSQSAITFDVKDCKVYPLTSDVASASTAYGGGIDVPGIQEVSLEPNFITNELKGDGGVVLAKKGKIDRLNFSCTYSELSLIVLEVLLGTTPATTGGGTGDAETATLAIDDTSLPYFKIAFLIDDLQTSGEDLATVVVSLQKCQLTGGSLVSGSTDSFNSPTFTAEGIKPAGDPVRFGQLSFQETAETL
jgi:hypothetical protein